MASIVVAPDLALAEAPEPGTNADGKSQRKSKGVDVASTPMRKLADPISYQILPSRSSRSSATDDAALMPPPRASGRHKRVLDEDQYTEVLGNKLFIE